MYIYIYNHCYWRFLFLKTSQAAEKKSNESQDPYFMPFKVFWINLQPLLQVLPGSGSVLLNAAWSPIFLPFSIQGKWTEISTPDDKKENLIKARLYEGQGRQREWEEREDNFLNHQTSLIFPHQRFSLLIFMRQQAAPSCQHITSVFCGWTGEGFGSAGPLELSASPFCPCWSPLSFPQDTTSLERT